MDELHTLIARNEQEREALTVRFERESEVVKRIVTAEAALVAAQAAAATAAASATIETQGMVASDMPAPIPVETEPTVADLSQLRLDLAVMQGDDPLLQPVVDAGVVAAVVAEWTGIPVGRMMRDEVQSVLTLADTLEKRVIGQRHGLDAVARRIQTARAQLRTSTRRCHEAPWHNGVDYRRAAFGLFDADRLCPPRSRGAAELANRGGLSAAKPG